LINCVMTDSVVNDPSSCTLVYKDFGFGFTIHYKTHSETGTGWCSQNTCDTRDASWTITLTQDTQVDVTMLLQTRTLQVKLSGGPGNISVDPFSDLCSSGATCYYQVNYGTHVTLTVSTPPRTVFLSWGGNCKGQGNPCVLTITDNSDAVANVGAPPTPSPSPTKPPPTASPSVKPSTKPTAHPTSTPAVTITPTPAASLASAGTPSPTTTAGGPVSTPFGSTSQPPTSTGPSGSGPTGSPTAVAAVPGGSQGAQPTPTVGPVALTGDNPDDGFLTRALIIFVGLLALVALAIGAYGLGRRRRT
jgi:hypothetical protein